VHGDLDALDSVIAKARQGNSVGQGFDQIQWVPFDIGNDRLSQRAIVDGPSKIITAGRQRKIENSADVDHELLTLLALGAEYAVMAEGGNSSQADSVAADLRGSAPGVNDCLCRHITS
jgi:hypothetical protein